MKKSQRNSITFAAIVLIIILLSIKTFLKNVPNENEGLKLIVKHLDEEKWYYEIYKNKKIFIKQEGIPAITGTIHFTSKVYAEAVGNLVLKKIKEGKTPSVTVSELKNLGINTIN